MNSLPLKQESHRKFVYMSLSYITLSHFIHHFLIKYTKVAMSLLPWKSPYLNPWHPLHYSIIFYFNINSFLQDSKLLKLSFCIKRAVPVRRSYSNLESVIKINNYFLKIKFKFSQIFRLLLKLINHTITSLYPQS